MSLCHRGLQVKLTDTRLTVVVSADEPLLALANALDWAHIAQLAMPDLQRTAKGCWNRGRRLSLRSHLAVMILQTLLKETDRGIERRIRHTPVLQVFCGKSVLPDWRCPDHTKIEALRNRLTPETHRVIGEYVLRVAQGYGFAERIRKTAQGYFFLARTASIEVRRRLFKRYHGLVKRELRPVIKLYQSLGERRCRALPRHIRRTLEQVSSSGWRYLLDVGHFVRTHTLEPGKRLAFHAEAVTCIKKGKAGKPHEFGRVFQLGRIGGNFLIPFSCTDVRMQDQHSLLPAIHAHRALFGEGHLKQVGTDKGYYSATNIKAIEALAINADGVQRPSEIKQRPPPQIVQALERRRAGIEPLIQHAESFGLGRSRMKSDQTTLASGYRAVMGFNLHQLMRSMDPAKA